MARMTRPVAVVHDDVPAASSAARARPRAGQKSFQRKDRPPQPPEDGGSNPTVNFHGEKRSNRTHQSTTDPEAMLYRKSGASESKLSYLGHVLMENRNGLVVDTRLTRGAVLPPLPVKWLASCRLCSCHDPAFSALKDAMPRV